MGVVRYSIGHLKQVAGGRLCRAGLESAERIFGLEREVGVWDAEKARIPLADVMKSLCVLGHERETRLCLIELAQRLTPLLPVSWRLDYAHHLTSYLTSIWLWEIDKERSPSVSFHWQALDKVSRQIEHFQVTVLYNSPEWFFLNNLQRLTFPRLETEVEEILDSCRNLCIDKSYFNTEEKWTWENLNRWMIK